MYRDRVQNEAPVSKHNRKLHWVKDRERLSPLVIGNRIDTTNVKDHPEDASYAVERVELR